MNERAHWLSLFSAVMHLAIGVPELLHLGPRFLPPSWALIYGVMPNGTDWLWPAMFALTGAIAALGSRLPWALKLGFLCSAVIFLIWGVVGLYSWSIGSGGNIPGAAANVFLAGCAWVLAHYVTIGVKTDVINEKVAALGEVVHQVEEARKADEIANGG